MDCEDYSDAALVLLGHGSTANPESGAPVFLQAAELRRRRQLAEVREAFWKQEPQVTRVLPALAHARIFLVPLFISEGYFTESRIPLELGFGRGTTGFLPTQARRRPNPGSPAAGTHDRMAGLLLARARDMVCPAPFPARAGAQLHLLVHRRPRHPAERELAPGHRAPRAVAPRFGPLCRRAGRVPGRAAAHRRLFLPGSNPLPRRGAVFHRRRSARPGRHSRLLGDAERLVQERLRAGVSTWRNPTERHDKLVWFASSIGAEPQLAEVILERVREAVSRQ